MKRLLIALNILCYTGGVTTALLNIAKGQMPESQWNIVAGIVVFNILCVNIWYRKTRERRIKWVIFWLICSYIVLAEFWTYSYAIKHGITPP